VGGIGQCLDQASKIIQEVKEMTEPDMTTNNNKEDPEQPISSRRRKALRQLASELFQQTNSAGLYVPIQLYGDMGLYESSPRHPMASLRGDAFHQLGKLVDETALHVCLVLWALGEMDLEDEAGLRPAAVKQLKAASKVALSIAGVLSGPRQTYKSSDTQEALSNLNPICFCVKMDETPLSTKDTKLQLKETCVASLETGKAFMEQVGNLLQALLVYNVLSDLTSGQ
jgi:hypothetical protein